MRGMMRITTAAAAAVLLLSACTIADVAVAPGEDRLVVEGVLRTDASRQFILLHRGVQSGVAEGVPDAEVVVTRGDGVRMVFEQTAFPCYKMDPAYADADEPVDIRGTCYVSRAGEGHWVNPGATYDLSVRTTRGDEARGRTVVPGAFTLRNVPVSRVKEAAPAECTLPPATPLALTWTQSAGAWGYVAPLRIEGLRQVLPDSFNAPDPLELVGVAVSSADTSLVLPGQFGVFDRFRFNQNLLRLLQTGLPDGTTARLVLAAADRNYINGVRGGSFNPSGPVRISSIVGDGVGVFGSLVPLHASIVVGAPSPERPYCTG
ncbi:MAG: DUF4249 domain-containing protein [Gemmatimonadetes bacterium]|nr:DUF4249 domain-containing protein [Gemmatimonadota bacterium]